jgi:hypothetical protein
VLQIISQHVTIILNELRSREKEEEEEKTLMVEFAKNVIDKYCKIMHGGREKFVS